MLTENQKQAAQMLINRRYLDSAEQMKSIAETVGVHRCTLWRWTKKKEFRAELRRLRRIQEKRRARRRRKIKAELESQWDAALSEWEARVESCAEKVRKRTELCGNCPDKELLDAQKALKNALAADPFRGLFPDPKQLRKSKKNQTAGSC